MGIWELMLIAVALSMDAFAVGMTDGMEEPNMPLFKRLAVAAAFGAFQALMPLLGYYAGAVFAGLVERIAPWLSFAILVFIGGKAVVSSVLEERRGKRIEKAARARLTPAKLFAQAVATALDALAVGVTLVAAEATDRGARRQPPCGACGTFGRGRAHSHRAQNSARRHALIALDFSKRKCYHCFDRNDWFAPKVICLPCMYGFGKGKPLWIGK